MPSGARLDPLTRDFVATSGDFDSITNPTLEELQLRVLTHRGTCFWDLEFGSTLHRLPTEKIAGALERDVADRARDALRPMERAGQISGVRVEVERIDRNRVDMRLSALDAGRRPLRFQAFVEV